VSKHGLAVRQRGREQRALRQRFRSGNPNGSGHGLRVSVHGADFVAGRGETVQCAPRKLRRGSERAAPRAGDGRKASMSPLLALGPCLCVAAPGARFFSGEKSVPSADALGAPAPVVARIQEVEAELPAFAGKLSFTWTKEPADVLLVTTIEPTPAA